MADRWVDRDVVLPAHQSLQAGIIGRYRDSRLLSNAELSGERLLANTTMVIASRSCQAYHPDDFQSIALVHFSVSLGSGLVILIGSDFQSGNLTLHVRDPHVEAIPEHATVGARSVVAGYYHVVRERVMMPSNIELFVGMSFDWCRLEVRDHPLNHRVPTRH